MPIEDGGPYLVPISRMPVRDDVRPNSNTNSHLVNIGEW